MSERIRTRHGEMSLQEIAEALPGTAEIMAEVGRAYSGCWHAAEGGNWELCAYFFRRTRNLLRRLQVRRPKYADQLRAYDEAVLTPLAAAVAGRELEGFRRAYQAGVDLANFYHVETGHAYIRWSVPESPPEGLDLGPGE